MRWMLALLAWPLAAAPPQIDKLAPLGWQRGAAVEATFTGKGLERTTGLEFDAPDFTWKTIEAAKDKLRGTITIGPSAALGPHLVRIRSLDGDSPTVLFNVGQFAAVAEKEPNDTLAAAQVLSGFPLELYGELRNRAESDFYAVDAKAGDRLSFDLRSTEIGSYLESKMYLLDAGGKRLAVSDDRSDFDDTPLLHYAFTAAGRYYLHIDQFHGLRAADPKNNTYILRVSTLPYFESLSRLGASPGTKVRIALSGQRMDTLTRLTLTPVRLAEYYRFTYPHTMTVHVRPDAPSTPLEGRIVSKSVSTAEAELDIPAGAATGLYRLWGHSPQGIAEAFQFEISATHEAGEDPACPLRPGDAVNGSIDKPRQRDSYLIQATAGQPLHIYTFSAQFGLAPLDSVLQLRDGKGTVLAENDDVVSGASSLGNPDSSLFYTPQESGSLHLTVRDRLNRGGAGFVYRLRIDQRKPAFQMWTMPDNFTVTRGETGELTVRMTRDMGFEKDEVNVWLDGLPAGVEAPKSRFRSDQAWELGGDGLQMTTPEIVLPIRVGAAVPAGRYAFRVLGAANNGPIVTAQANMIRGPLTNLFNFVRRPLAELTLTVIDPPAR